MPNKPSVRLHTLLVRNDLGLFQAFRKSDKELLAIRNFGRKTLAELREIQWGLKKETQKRRITQWLGR